MIEQQTKTTPLPKGWVLTSIGEITEVVRGASPRPKGDPRYFGGNIPWIKISDVSKEKGKFVSETKDTVTKEGASKSRLLEKGTLILSNSGTVCVPKILAVDGCIHDGFVAFPDLTKNVNKLLLYYFFEYIRPRIIQENRQGVTQVNLNTTIVRNIPFLFPPFSEQGRIVCKLEELFTRLDAGVASLKKVKAQLQLYRQAVLKHAFNGKLTQEWRKNREFPESSKFQEEIQKERLLHLGKKMIMPSIGPFELPKLPKNWMWTRIDWLCDVQTGPFGTQLHRSDYSSSGIPTIEIGDVYPNRDLKKGTKKFIPRKKAIELKKYEVKHGDVLFSRVGTVGRCTVVPKECEGWIMSTSLIRVRITSNYLLPKFLLLYFWSPLAQGFTAKTSKGTTRAGTNSKIVGGLPLILPPVTEQQKIIEEIELRFSISGINEKTIEKGLSQSDGLRQSILKTAFLGKLVAQDDRDEPAIRLLARIKQEKKS